MARRVCAAVAVSASAIVASGQENHVTVDTAGGQILIKTGYEPSESDFWIDPDGWMRFGDEVLERESLSPWLGSEFTGWQAGGETVLTSDWFAATGRLDGGDYYYEIAGFEHVGGSRESDFVWAERDGGDLEWYGQANGATRLERSFHVGFSGHPHGQIWLAEKPGLYALTLVAWDANGVYADSDPVRFHIRSVPTPGALGVLGIMGVVASWRNRKPLGV
jgi:hypothetical protein